MALKTPTFFNKFPKSDDDLKSFKLSYLQNQTGDRENIQIISPFFRIIEHVFEVKDAFSIYWMSSLRLEENTKITRDELMAELKNLKIDTRPVFPAISQYPIWGHNIAPQPTALIVGSQSINLPSGVCLRREQIDYVCRSIRELMVY